MLATQALMIFPHLFNLDNIFFFNELVGLLGFVSLSFCLSLSLSAYFLMAKGNIIVLLFQKMVLTIVPQF
jgi:hypothetical protein